MMGGFAGLDTEDLSLDEELAVEGLSDLPVFLQGMVMERVEEFGENVRLTAIQKETNDAGWEGYMARLAFDDVNEIRMTSGMGGDDEMDADETEYRVEFTPGETAELRLIPRTPEPGAAATEPEMQMTMTDEDGTEIEMEDMDIDMDFDMDLGEAMDGMDDAMGAMFANMFKGMRMRMLIEVEGEIVETDASHRSTSRPNRIALVDVDMDKLMEHPDALQRLMGEDQQAMYELQKEGAPGLLMEDPEKPIMIRFR